MKNFVTTLCGLGTAFLLSAQPCATPSGRAILDVSFDKNEYLDNGSDKVERRSWRKALGGLDALFEVKFYAVLAAGAPETLPPGTFEEALNRLNSQFDGSGITFRQAGKVMGVTDDVLAEMQINDAYEMQLHREKQAGKLIHVFITDLIQNGEVRGYSYNPFLLAEIPDFKQNMLVITREGLLDNSTLAHEMGHFFGLFHTHEDRFGALPDLPESDNCTQTGDYVCDTPPDPNMFNRVTPDCRCKDEDGNIHFQRFQPAIENIMSYATAACRRRFTEGQRYRMMQCAHLKRQNLIVAGLRDNGVPAPYMIPLTLAKAFEMNYRNGGSRMALIFVHNKGSNSSRRMFGELAGMIDHSSPFHNLIPLGKSGGFTLAVYDADNPDDFTKDFIGNVLFHQDKYAQQREFDWIMVMLQQRMAQYPALFVLRMERMRDADFLVLDYLPGYFKPRELKALFAYYTPLLANVLGKK